MSNTMAAHEPIHYLDSILNEEETRREYSHQWRNFTISRSGRFKSKNKKRDAIDGQFFDTSASASGTSNVNASYAATSKAKDELASRGSTSAHVYKEQDKMGYRQSSTSSKSYSTQSTGSNTGSRTRDKPDSYKSFYETNL